MRSLFRRTEIALSLDRPLTVQTQPDQIRDIKTNLILTVSAEIHVTYRVINSKSFAHHYADFASFDAVFSERLKGTASSALGDVLSDKDRSCFAKESIKIGQQVIELLKPFTNEAGVVIFTCSCIPVVQDSARSDEVEMVKAFNKIDSSIPVGTLSKLLSQAGAWSGMHPAMNALWGKAINPIPQRPQKDNPLI